MLLVFLFISTLCSSVFAQPNRTFLGATYGCNGVTQIELCSVSGTKLLSNEFYANKGENKFDLDMSGFPAGIYLCKIGNTQNAVKVIKK
jgi:hypothetical protein